MFRARIWMTLVAALATGACDQQKIEDESARMAADTGLTPSAPPTAGPLPPPGAGDADLVMDATKYEITDQNFERFARASEGLAYLRARDVQVRTMLEQAGTTADADAGSLLARLEEHPQVSQAISSAGMSVKDYYVMAIALAAAQRHSANPQAAPPTPTGTKNAEWVRRNASKLGRLQTWGAAVAR